MKLLRSALFAAAHGGNAWLLRPLARPTGVCVHARRVPRDAAPSSRRAWGSRSGHGSRRLPPPASLGDAGGASTTLSAGGGGLTALKNKLQAVQARHDALCQLTDLPACKARLALLEDQAAQGDLWDDPPRAQALLSQVNLLRSQVEAAAQSASQLEEAAFAVELLEESQGTMSAAEQGDITGQALGTLQALEAALARMEVQRLLSGPYDDRGARLTITAGAGGVDAMDWAEMLERMYLRWAQREARGYAVRVVDRSPGEEAGVKSVELEVAGPFAYGWLKSERGTHRLVRSSPFNAKGLRQTSFAGVEVLPILGDGAEGGGAAALELRDGDLELQFFRSSGAGGQNVNKVESGVRITHVPTGIAVKCMQERTQLANRAIAMDMLRAKLLVVMEEQAAKKVAEIRGDMVVAAWGQQIRSYVLHPYSLVKCTRTGHETSDTDGVLGGELLDGFMEAFLRHKGQREAAAALAEGGELAVEAAGSR